MLPPGINDVELFASYFNSTVTSPVLVYRDTIGTEVIFGDVGILFASDNSVKIRCHSDYPISSDAVPPNVEWQDVLGVDFHDAMKEFRMSNTFSTETMFPVNQ